MYHETRGTHTHARPSTHSLTRSPINTQTETKAPAHTHICAVKFCKEREGLVVPIICAVLAVDVDFTENTIHCLSALGVFCLATHLIPHLSCGCVPNSAISPESNSPMKVLEPPDIIHPSCSAFHLSFVLRFLKRLKAHSLSFYVQYPVEETQNLQNLRGIKIAFLPFVSVTFNDMSKKNDWCSRKYGNVATSWMTRLYYA